MTIYETTKQGEIEIKKRMRGLVTGWGAVWKQVKAIHKHGNRNGTFNHMQRRIGTVISG